MIDFLRALPPFKGKKRLINYLLGHRRKDIKDQVVPFIGKSNLILPNIIESSCWNVYCDQTYEASTIKIIDDHLKSDEVFLDIGANIGIISIAVSIHNPSTQIVAVEASPSNYNYLKRNIELNQITNIQPISKAVHAQSSLKLPFYFPEEKIGCGSFSPVFTDIAIMVETITLDDIAENTLPQKIGLIKVDVEGYELLVFKGGKKLLSSDHAPAIIFEFVDWAESRAKGLSAGDAQKQLLDYGYTLYAFNKKGHMKKIDNIITKGTLNIFASKHLS